jgi:hypothetical protein
MANDILSPVFDENNVEVLKQSLERVAALCEVAWLCSDKFKELSNAGRFNYFSLMDTQILIARTELENILMRFSD